MSNGASTVHLTPESIQFTESSINHLNIMNIGSNSHAQIDTHIADSTIHFTEGSIDHGLIGGLSDDDHAQYALLAGRPASQILNGGTGVGDTLTLRGSADSTLGVINVESPFQFFQVEAESTAPSFNIKIQDDYTTATGVVVQGTIQSTRTLGINTGIWFVSQIQDNGIYNQLVTPGFSAFTLFNAFPVISTGGPTAATALIGSVGLQVAIIHENDGDGAGIGTFRDDGLAYRPGVRATTVGDTIFKTDSSAVRVFPQLIAEVAGSTVTLTTVRGVHLVEPSTIGHVGTGILDAYVGLDMDDIAFGTGTKVALRCALTAAANSFCIQHIGTAQSLFGGAVEIAGNLENTSGRTKATTRVTTTYTILVSDHVIFGNTDSGAFTATLPAGVQGRTFKVINSGSSGNALTLAPDGSDDLIGANSNFTLLDGETLDITYDTTDGWY